MKKKCERRVLNTSRGPLVFIPLNKNQNKQRLHNIKFIIYIPTTFSMTLVMTTIRVYIKNINTKPFFFFVFYYYSITLCVVYIWIYVRFHWVKNIRKNKIKKKLKMLDKIIGTCCYTEVGYSHSKYIVEKKIFNQNEHHTNVMRVSRLVFLCRYGRLMISIQQKKKKKK